MYSARHEIHIKQDDTTGLFAIIALDDRNAKISFGGCRCLPYSSSHTAIDDAIRLATAMRKKSLICDMDYGGAKAVLIRPQKIEDRDTYFKSFGRFVNELEGRFVTGCDSGITANDMQTASSVCKYITACNQDDKDKDNLSDLTAIGLKCAIETVLKARLGQSSVSGLHIAIQGVGKVGYALAKELKSSGARLTLTDIDIVRAKLITLELGAEYVSPENIYDVDCDVFSPCALGSVLNTETVERIKAFLICDAANNQLQNEQIQNELSKNEIIYVPDFLCNSGGFIYAVENYFGGDAISAKKKIITKMTRKVSEIYELGLKMNSSMEGAARKILFGIGS